MKPVLTLIRIPPLTQEMDKPNLRISIAKNNTSDEVEVSKSPIKIKSKKKVRFNLEEISSHNRGHKIEIL